MKNLKDLRIKIARKLLPPDLRQKLDAPVFELKDLVQPVTQVIRTLEDANPPTLLEAEALVVHSRLLEVGGQELIDDIVRGGSLDFEEEKHWVC